MKSDTELALAHELRNIWDNRDFVCGVISNAGTETAWMKLLDYIQTARARGTDLTADEILLVSLDIGNEFSKSIPYRETAIAAVM